MRTPARVLPLLICLGLIPSPAHGAVIEVFNTGLDEFGNVLGEDAEDPHYEIFAGPVTLPRAVAATSAGGFPIGPWVAETPTSTWVTPSASTNGPPGDYTYRTTFNVAGLRPETVVVTGRWATDNIGTDVLVNGVPSNNPNPAQFPVFTPFAAGGARAGSNTLDFVLNNAPPGENPTGVHVTDLSATGFAEGTRSITLHNTGVSGPNNPNGTNSTVLTSGGTDTHYFVTTPGGFDALPASVVLNQPAYFNGAGNSLFVNNTGNGQINEPVGVYTYRTVFDLTGLDPSTASILGRVLVDNDVTDVLINGTSTGITASGFDANSFRDFAIESGFVEGTNTLDFLVNNAGDTPNPTAFRVDLLRGAAMPIPEPSAAVFAVAGLALLALRRYKAIPATQAA